MVQRDMKNPSEKKHEIGTLHESKVWKEKDTNSLRCARHHLRLGILKKII